MNSNRPYLLVLARDVPQAVMIGYIKQCDGLNFDLEDEEKENERISERRN